SGTLMFTSARPGRTWTSSGTARAGPRWRSAPRTTSNPSRRSVPDAALDPGRLPLVVQFQPRAVVGLPLRARRQLDRLLLPLHRVGELPALGAGRRERVEEARLGPLGQLARPGGALPRPLPVADVRVGARRPDPAELVERPGV